MDTLPRKRVLEKKKWHEYQTMPRMKPRALSLSLTLASPLLLYSSLTWDKIGHGLVIMTHDLSNSHPSDPFNAESLEIRRHCLISACHVCQQSVCPIVREQFDCESDDHQVRKLLLLVRLG